MERRITADAAPALGDVRQMGHGDTLWLAQGARERSDWSRCVEALGAAVSRGAEVRWSR
ncbi:hypothetical protein GCM10010289_82150 [Streptomyces violascens]|uniref:D-ribose pyranase n=1 Tax=Streptomyces violascens TaxID=67381 RepID=A0ABQ3QQU7_9ACTN|nr:hypothetical protein GCM10010289_82150 [Streptomyces violascens]GHI39641.1 hypothetical protein Sviol_40490 [Streptomyces violascens]